MDKEIKTTGWKYKWHCPDCGASGHSHEPMMEGHVKPIKSLGQFPHCRNAAGFLRAVKCEPNPEYLTDKDRMKPPGVKMSINMSMVSLDEVPLVKILWDAMEEITHECDRQGEVADVISLMANNALKKYSEALKDKS